MYVQRKYVCTEKICVSLPAQEANEVLSFVNKILFSVTQSTKYSNYT